jgi:hypothetical protein
MRSLEEFLEEQLSRGRAWFTKPEALHALGATQKAFASAAWRLALKDRLLSPRRGFYLILRPEDRIAGAPDPARWIDPLLRSMKLDYRISLLRAAAFHGSSHQAAMVFQVIVPRQLPEIVAGRHKIVFIYQSKAAFAQTNRKPWLDSIKTDAGYAQVAGVELTLLDSTRYFHKAAGLNGAAQIVHDLGGKAKPRILAEAAAFYENSAVRRLGYLLEHFGHKRQADALTPCAAKAKSFKELDPSVRQIGALADPEPKRNFKWKLLLNEIVEIDT